MMKEISDVLLGNVKKTKTDKVFSVFFQTYTSDVNMVIHKGFFQRIFYPPRQSKYFDKYILVG